MCVFGLAQFPLVFFSRQAVVVVVAFSLLLPFVRGDGDDGWENCLFDSFGSFYFFFFLLVLVGCFDFIWYDYVFVVLRPPFSLFFCFLSVDVAHNLSLVELGYYVGW